MNNRPRPLFIVHCSLFVVRCSFSRKRRPGIRLCPSRAVPGPGIPEMPPIFLRHLRILFKRPLYELRRLSPRSRSSVPAMPTAQKMTGRRAEADYNEPAANKRPWYTRKLSRNTGFASGRWEGSHAKGSCESGQAGRCSHKQWTLCSGAPLPSSG